MRQQVLLNLVIVLLLFLGLAVLFGSAGHVGQASLVARGGGEELTAKLPVPELGLPKLINGGVALPVDARAFLVAYWRGSDLQILVEKNSEEPLPIASITKLFTASVVISEDNLLDEVRVRPTDLFSSSVYPFYSGEVFLIRDLLYSLLIESNNASAALLARRTNDDFVARMNQLAGLWGLNQTSFSDPTGLDPAPESAREPNQSSARDLLSLTRHLFDRFPEIFEISTQTQYPLYTSDGYFHHLVETTNELLVEENNGWPAKILGSKTGQTDLAKKSLLMVFEDQKSGGKLIAIVLGAEDHFTTMKNLVDWVYTSYEFPPRKAGPLAGDN